MALPVHPIILLETDRVLLPAGMPLAQAVAAAIAGGVNMVLFAEEDLPSVPRRTVAGFVRDAVAGKALLLLADPVVASNRVLREANLEQPLSPLPDGFSCLLARLDWKIPERALGELEAIAAAEELPVVAGGEVPLEQVRACLSAGASGVQVCARVLFSSDPASAAREWAARLRRALQFHGSANLVVSTAARRPRLR